jgi:hydrogenase/urease accessory protein HupE
MNRTLVLALAALLSLARGAYAHSMAPALFEITALDAARYAVVWKVGLVQPLGLTLRPVLPADCVQETAPAQTATADSVFTRWVIGCGAEGLVGRTVGVEGLATGKTDALVRVTLADGRLVQGVLRGSDPELVIPARPRRLDVLVSYGKLGVEHILSGPDHLLFVLGLLLLVGSPRLLVRTITAFTVGHSITLALAVLGIVALPSRPIEVGIAASVFLLAVELTRAPRPTPTMLRRAPYVMAGAFGLLHGLAFAGALAEVGLPSGEIPLALLAFNVGIELGQVAFVAVVLGAGWMFRGVVTDWPAWGALGPAYVMGSLSAFWCLQRTATLVLGP